VTIHTILAHESAPFNRGRAGRKINNGAQEKYYPGCKVDTVFVGVNHFGSHYGIIFVNAVYGDFCVIGQLHDPYGMVE